MANLLTKDGYNHVIFLKATGLGTDADPHILAVDSSGGSGGATEAKQDDLIALLPTALTGSGNLKVAVQESLPAGTNAIGKLAANSGVDIGDVDVTSIAAGENHLGKVGGNTSAVSVSFTRPADTTAYAAKDAVSNSTSAPTVLTFTNLARVSAGSGYITKARLMTDQAANVARFRLHLYHTAPTAINDNAQHAMLWANRANRIGFIDFEAMQTEGTGSDTANALNSTIRLAFVCAAASRTLYGLLETRDAFTPANAQNFFIELMSENN